MTFRSGSIPRLLILGLVILAVASLAYREMTTGELGASEFEQARQEEKEGRYQHALELLEKAVRSSPGDIDYSHRYCVALYRASRFEESEAIAKENLPRLLELARVDPERHLPALLENRKVVADIARSRGNLTEAEKAYQEACELYWKLPDPERQNLSLEFVALAQSLAGIYQVNAEAKENQGAPGEAKDYWHKAAKLYGEARDIYWKFSPSERQQRHLQFMGLTESLAGVYLARAEARQTAGALSEAQEYWTEAEKLYGEGRDVYRKLSSSEQREHFVLLADLSRSLAKANWTMGRAQPAEEVLFEIRDKLWRLSKENPTRYSPSLSAVLTDLAQFALAHNKIKEAQESSEESLSVCRRLSRTEPKLYASTLFASLPTAAAVYRAQKRWTQARETYDEAQRLYWKFPGEDRESRRPEMVSILESLAAVEQAQGNRKAEIAALEEARDLGWRLVRGGQQKYGAMMARILDRMAVLASERRDFGEANQCYEDAAWIYRMLCRSNRDGYGDRLALALLGSAAAGLQVKNSSGVCRILDEASDAARTAEVQYRVSQAKAKASCPGQIAADNR